MILTTHDHLNCGACDLQDDEIARLRAEVEAQRQEIERLKENVERLKAEHDYDSKVAADALIEAHRSALAALAVAHERVRRFLIQVVEQKGQITRPLGTREIAERTLAMLVPDGAKVVAVIRAAVPFAHPPTFGDTFLVSGKEVNALRDALAALRDDPAWKEWV